MITMFFMKDKYDRCRLLENVHSQECSFFILHLDTSDVQIFCGNQFLRFDVCESEKKTYLSCAAEYIKSAYFFVERLSSLSLLFLHDSRQR